MERDEEGGSRSGVLPFQLQFDKPIPSQIKIAEWNPEKDLLAMVTDDSKLLLHRFNWQRLWTFSPGKCITSLCWRPDGKAVAIGLEDGTISLHDVENGKLLRSIKSHTVAVVCLNWEEDGQTITDGSVNISTYEDRTSRFFPPAPRAPRMPGVVPGDSGFMDDSEDSFQELSNSSSLRFNILCSADKDGYFCFSIFGIIPIGKINIHNLTVQSHIPGDLVTNQLLNASICKVALSKDLCNLIVMCSGEVIEVGAQSTFRQTARDSFGLYCLVLDTSIFDKRKNELHQVAQQASNIEDLTEVIRTSLSVMLKQWSDGMHMFREKFNCLSSLINDHGLDSTPQEEFLSLLGGSRTSPPIHQFLVNSLGEAGLKRVSKVICGAGKELQLIVLDHLQPAAEMIAFRMGELRGLSKWRARYRGIGLEEKLIESATEKAGMLLIQAERFLQVLSSALQQFSNFFCWLLKSVKILMSEPSDQLLPFSSELVIVFLKFLYDQDPIKKLLESSEVEHSVEVDLETMQRIKELSLLGGFSDTDYLKRTLAEEFKQMESCFKQAFGMPFAIISKKLLCRDLLPLFHFESSLKLTPSNIPVSVSYYKEASYAANQQGMVGYILFQVPDESFPNVKNCIGIARGFVHDFGNSENGQIFAEAALLSIPEGYSCADLFLYKEGEIILLLNEIAATSESAGNACMMLIQVGELPFIPISRSANLTSWIFGEIKESVIYMQSENEKVRSIPHSVVPPFAVSASRGVACVFAARKRALVYILEEDEDEISESE